jgi:hypothetical protein
MELFLVAIYEQDESRHSPRRTAHALDLIGSRSPAVTRRIAASRPLPAWKAGESHACPAFYSSGNPDISPMQRRHRKIACARNGWSDAARALAAKAALLADLPREDGNAARN